VACIKPWANRWVDPPSSSIDSGEQEQQHSGWQQSGTAAGGDAGWPPCGEPRGTARGTASSTPDREGREAKPDDTEPELGHDSSTNALIRRYRDLKR
jgi:hypothetical protein